MFDSIRKHSRFTMVLLFALIVPSFIFFGLDGYNRTNEKTTVVARVDGKKITQSEWDATHTREVDRLRASMPGLDAKLLDSPQARYATLERLVRDAVFTATVAQARLSSSDQRLARELQSNPQITALIGADGRLDIKRYEELLRAEGLSPEVFEANVRADLSKRQVLAGVIGGALPLKIPADIAFAAYYEKRDIQLLRLKPADYAAKLSPSDAELEKFYQANQTLFQAPEQASIEYIVLDAETVKKNITVTEQELKSYYAQNTQRLASEQERRASHILINAAKTAPKTERQAARAKADQLLALARKSPENFAVLARENSQDSGSAPNGGDLGFFGQGAMVKPFEDVVFRLQKGQISDVVETEFGFHIIRLTDIKEAKQRSFEEAKVELENDLKNQHLQKKFAEAAEIFTNGVYEQPESLKPVAERLKIDIKKVNNLSRTPAAGAPGPLANPKFLDAIFSPDTREKKHNTEAIEVGPSQLASAHLLEYVPARTLAFAEVKDQVKVRWLSTQSLEAARKDGAAKLAAWNANPSLAVLPETITVVRGQTQTLPNQITEAVMRSDPSTLPLFVGVDLGAQGYAVVKVVKILPQDQRDQAQAAQDRTQFSRSWNEAESLAYYKLLQRRFKAEIKVDKSSLLPANVGTRTY